MLESNESNEKNEREREREIKSWQTLMGGVVLAKKVQTQALGGPFWSVGQWHSEKLAEDAMKPKNKDPQKIKYKTFLCKLPFARVHYFSTPWHILFVEFKFTNALVGQMEYISLLLHRKKLGINLTMEIWNLKLQVREENVKKSKMSFVSSSLQNNTHP